MSISCNVFGPLFLKGGENDFLCLYLCTDKLKILVYSMIVSLKTLIKIKISVQNVNESFDLYET